MSDLSVSAGGKGPPTSSGYSFRLFTLSFFHIFAPEANWKIKNVGA